MINGIINVYKEAEFTSHDVVAKLRGILKQKKIGHTGTLDPAATGVLPVCLGSGTKLCDLLTDKSKEYEAVMLLGLTTDTEDTTGNCVLQQDVESSESDVIQAIKSFVGKYEQIPPMYSAIKINGKKLYELARNGVTIERPARMVEIFDINILNIEMPRVRMKINCSKGTYIRSLCRDIGEKLGCGGCMESLKRTRVGIFDIDNAYTLEQIKEIYDSENILKVVTPVDSLFDMYSEYRIQNEQQKKLVKNGNSFKSKKIDDSENIRIYIDDKFYGIYRYEQESELYVPVKMFFSGE